MGKKAANKKAEGKSSGHAQSGPAAAAAANIAVSEPPKTFEDTLTPEQLEQEKKKREERQRKAEESQRRQLRENAWKEEKAKEEARKQLVQQRETRGWEREVAAAKQRAFKEGVKETQESEDTYWVDLGDNLWKEVKDKYYCTLCDSHLNDNSLQCHIDSQAHRKKVEWAIPSMINAPPVPPPPVIAAPLSPPVLGGALPLVLQKAFAGHLEAWQEMMPDHTVRCIPCQKYIDEAHVTTSEHRNRLERWLEQENLKRNKYPAPALIYLAWVPTEDGSDERWQKCLLCDKWVQDEQSHSGTRQNPGGSKDHKKRLINYGPGDPWWEENVRKQREKYHPTAPKVPSTSSASAAPAPPRLAPWATSVSAPTSALPPTAAYGAAPAAAPAAAPPAAPAATPAPWAAAPAAYKTQAPDATGALGPAAAAPTYHAGPQGVWGGDRANAGTTSSAVVPPPPPPPPKPKAPPAGWAPPETLWGPEPEPDEIIDV